MRLTHLGVLVAAAIANDACAGGSGTSSTPATDAPATSSEPTASGPTNGAPSGETVQITIGTATGAELKFDPSELTVQAGADVHVTFENRSEVPHNLNFGPPINVASSAVVAPATSETLEFTAPGPGDYAFACTIHPGMGGKLIVAGS